MNYRGLECTEQRPFDDATGKGVEWRDPRDDAKTPWPAGEFCIRHGATRVVSPEEAKANADAAAARVVAEKRAAALTALVDEKLAATQGKL